MSERACPHVAPHSLAVVNPPGSRVRCAYFVKHAIRSTDVPWPRHWNSDSVSPLRGADTWTSLLTIACASYVTGWSLSTTHCNAQWHASQCESHCDLPRSGRSMQHARCTGQDKTHTCAGGRNARPVPPRRAAEVRLGGAPSSDCGLNRSAAQRNTTGAVGAQHSRA